MGVVGGGGSAGPCNKPVGLGVARRVVLGYHDVLWQGLPRVDANVHAVWEVVSHDSGYFFILSLTRLSCKEKQ